MVDFATVGRRLRTALEVNRVDLATVARDARVPQDVLARLEAGEAAPISTAALARVAHRLKLSPTALWSPAEEDFEVSLQFRHATIPDFFHADEVVAREALGVARDVEGLEDLLGRPAPLKRADWFRPVAVGHDPTAEGYRLARRLREILHQTSWLTSLTAPLTDPLEVIVEEAFGVPVLEKPLQTSSVLAVTVKDRSRGLAAILLNTASEWGARPLRRRVDLAHEIAHLLYDEPRADIGLWIDEIDDQDREAPKQQGDPHERRARAFAAELLLPRLGLHELFGRPQESVARSLTPAIELVQRARQHFKTTIELTSYHLENNGYIPAYLHDDIVKATPPFPMETPAARESLLPRRVREALSAGLISSMRARELLGLCAWDDLPWSASQ